MGIFDKIKGAINKLNEGHEQKVAEQKAKEEEENRFNPLHKDYEWFLSEDGAVSFKEYCTPQNYLLEDRIKEEIKNDSDFSGYDIDIVASVLHKGSKVPYTYFKGLAFSLETKIIDDEVLEKYLASLLSVQAKSVEVDEDGEPHQIKPALSPDEIVSIEKNPVLNYYVNFDCFEINDDNAGTVHDKCDLCGVIMRFLAIYVAADKDILANNQWVFAKETYINDMGMVRQKKAFLKKCLELSSIKKVFENELNMLE